MDRAGVGADRDQKFIDALHHLVGRQRLHQRKLLGGALIIVGENGFDFAVHVLPCVLELCSDQAWVANRHFEFMTTAPAAAREPAPNRQVN
jgi:hypothetical protein